MAKKYDLTKQAEEIIEIAEKSGAQSNFFFITTFKRYQVQLSMLNELEETIKKDGMLTEKTYSGKAKNLYAHPAVKEYNRTADAANKTVATLMKIIKNFCEDDKEAEEDPLMKIINGADEDDSE
ncbi:MAG: hypothetical protein E7242_05920 [Lachnospiraceae bacterium]|nr:hypothetical protein [Lachnospiraceae bacterium]